MKSIIAIASLLLFLVIYKKVTTKKDAEVGMSKPMSNSEGKGKAMPVKIIVASPQKVANDIFASGTLVANEEVELRPETAGRVIKLNIDEGSFVSKGQLIAKINDADILANLKKLKFEDELAKQIEIRQKKLLDINAISKEEYDLSLNKVHTLEADKESLEVALIKTELRAPFSGKIGLKNISIGAYITPSTTVANLIQTNPLKMDFVIPEKYYSDIKKGSKVIFTAEGSARQMHATVIAVDPKIDENLRTLKVRCSVANNDGKFLPGMFVKVSAPMSNKQSIMVPSQAIIPFVGGKKLFIIKEGKATEKTIVTGLRTESEVEILEGVSIGDTIVTSGLMSMKPGQALKAILQ